MIDKSEKKSCSGCKMCKDICPKSAISYEVNNEGFWFPKVDHDKCIQCGLCIKRCPTLTPIKCRTREPQVYAAWSKSDDIRLGSTSGGIFYELAKYILNNDGYVAGCVYDEDFKGAHQVLIHSVDDLKPLMVSKYVQSDTEDIYKSTKEAVLTGKPVLFVGSPCHVAALVSFLDREYDNLYICDFLCRGTNSPKAHKRYVEYLEKKYGGRMINLRSKDKRNGWERFGQAALFDNGKEYFLPHEEDLRVVAYHHGNIMVRESCLDCKFKHIPRDGADITLGDYWGIKSEDVKDIGKGISLVFTNTDKGQSLFDLIENSIDYINKDLESAKRGNPAIYQSAGCNQNREKFLASLDDEPFDILVSKYRSYPPKGVKAFLRRAKGKAKSIVRR